MPTSVATMNSSASESAGRLIIPSVERICTPSGSMSPADIASSTLVEQPHSGWMRNSASGCSARCSRMFSGIDAGVHVTLAHPHVDVLAPGHPPHVRAEEHVGQEEDLLVGGDGVHDLHRVARRAAVVALGLHLGRRVHVRDDDGARMLGLPLAELRRRRSSTRASSRRRDREAARSFRRQHPTRAGPSDGQLAAPHPFLAVQLAAEPTDVGYARRARPVLRVASPAALGSAAPCATRICGPTQLASARGGRKSASSRSPGRSLRGRHRPPRRFTA